MYIYIPNTSFAMRLARACFDICLDSKAIGDLAHEIGKVVRRCC